MHNQHRTGINGKNQRGFTLVELMIVVAIIGIISSVALPAYQNHSMKARFTELVQATSPIKLAVEECVVDGTCLSGSTIQGIRSGFNGFPELPRARAGGHMSSMLIAQNGTIKVIGDESVGNSTFVLKPETVNTGSGSSIQVSWLTDPASTCLHRGICK